MENTASLQQMMCLSLKTHKEALSSEHSAEWAKAMAAELSAPYEMKKWTLSELPPGSKPIGTK